jgi:hypothetical protein
MRRAWSFIIFCLLADGCVTDQGGNGSAVRVTLVTEPEGATLYHGDTKLGLGPVTTPVPEAATAFANGQCVTYGPVTAKWISGAEYSITGSLCPNQGASQQLVLLRPKGAPGLQQDLVYAQKLRQKQMDPGQDVQRAIEEQRSSASRGMMGDGMSGGMMP